MVSIIQIPATVDPIMFPMLAWEFQIPNINPFLPFPNQLFTTVTTPGKPGKYQGKQNSDSQLLITLHTCWLGCSCQDLHGNEVGKGVYVGIESQSKENWESSGEEHSNDKEISQIHSFGQITTEIVSLSVFSSDGIPGVPKKWVFFSNAYNFFVRYGIKMFSTKF